MCASHYAEVHGPYAHKLPTNKRTLDIYLFIYCCTVATMKLDVLVSQINIKQMVITQTNNN